MINASELRIGNYFGFYKPLEHELIIARATGIYFDDDYDQWHVQSLEYYPINLPDGAKPIPLTPEILEACGFILEPDGIRYGLAWNKESQWHRLSLMENDKGFWIIVDEVNMGTKKYLHQLQNLYFVLTGEELTVNITKEIA